MDFDALRTTLHMLGEVNLVIPAWQMGLFIGLVSLCMLSGRTQLGLIVTYLFVLYWGFILYGPDFVAATGGDPMALAFYIVCGLAIAFLAIIAFFLSSV
jgi:hypothetical protein